MSLSPYSVSSDPTPENPEQVILHDGGNRTAVRLTGRKSRLAESWLQQGWTPTLSEHGDEYKEFE